MQGTIRMAQTLGLSDGIPSLDAVHCVTLSVLRHVDCHSRNSRAQGMIPGAAQVRLAGDRLTNHDIESRGLKNVRRFF